MMGGSWAVGLWVKAATAWLTEGLKLAGGGDMRIFCKSGCAGSVTGKLGNTTGAFDVFGVRRENISCMPGNVEDFESLLSVGEIGTLLDEGCAATDARGISAGTCPANGRC